MSVKHCRKLHTHFLKLAVLNNAIFQIIIYINLFYTIRNNFFIAYPLRTHCMFKFRFIKNINIPFFIVVRMTISKNHFVPIFWHHDTLIVYKITDTTQCK